MKHTIDEIKAAFFLIHNNATGRSDRAFMSIPADPKRDADLILLEAIEELARRRKEGAPDPELVAVRAAIAALEPFRGETKRMSLLWRVARGLDVPKDLRPCCPCDEAPCIHDGKQCECWACQLLIEKGLPRLDREAAASAAKKEQADG